MLDFRTEETWTDERIAALKQHWSDGLSCSQIAGELGNGISRNAVIAKVHRLGLPRRGQSKTYNSPEERREARNSRRKIAFYYKPWKSLHPPRMPTHEAALQFLHKTLLDLQANECRFSASECAPFTFCGQRTEEGSSWCAHHLGIVFQRGDAF